LHEGIVLFHGFDLFEGYFELVFELFAAVRENLEELALIKDEAFKVFKE
jgi:hypothetical protein